MSEQLLIRARCRGITPVLFNRMTESELEGLRTKIKKPKAANIGNTRTPREQAEEKVYTHGGVPVLPAEMLMASLVAAGVFCRLDAKRQISTAKATILPGLMSLLDYVMPLWLPDSKTPAKWEPDVRKGTNPNGGEAVAICRPRFDAWSFEARCLIDTHEIGENTIRELWDKAGKRTGIGDHRPARKGIFGQFVVERWERLPEQAAAE